MTRKLCATAFALLLLAVAPARAQLAGPVLPQFGVTPPGVTPRQYCAKTTDGKCWPFMTQDPTTGVVGVNVSAASILAGLGYAPLPAVISGAPPNAGIFAGGGANANFWINMNAPAASATIPEIGAQFNVTSSIGGANPQSAYKIGLFSSAYCNTGSADCYGYNGNVAGYAGPAGAGYFGLYGAEVDLNNKGADPVPTQCGLNCAFGIMSLSGGTKKGTAGFRAGGTTATNAHFIGYMADAYIATDGFADYSTSAHVLAAYNPPVGGLHGAGIDFSAATFSSTIGMLLSNATKISEKTTSGAIASMLSIDTANTLQIGDPGLVGAVINSPLNSNYNISTNAAYYAGAVKLADGAGSNNHLYDTSGLGTAGVQLGNGVGYVNEDSFAIRNKAGTATYVSFGSGGIVLNALPTTGGTVAGTLCVDTTGLVYVKTTTGACK